MRTDPRTLKKEDLKKQVMQLRRDGYGIDDIALVTNTEPDNVKKIIKECIIDLRRDKTEETEEYIRTLEMRKENIVKAIMPKILKGDARSILAWVKTEENYQKVTGLIGKDLDINVSGEGIKKYYAIVSPEDWLSDEKKQEK